jgi:single-stranded DNA-binding protein
MHEKGIKMSRGIESAIYGSATRDGEIKQSKSGNNYGVVQLAVREGQDENGKEQFSYVKVMIFNDGMDEVLKIKKSDRVYCEGALEAKIWESDKGPKVDLTLRAFFLRKTGIGKERPRREAQPDQRPRHQEPDPDAFRNYVPY